MPPVYRGPFGKPQAERLLGGAALIAGPGRRSRLAAAAGGALVLAGEVAVRFSVFKAGFQSARDPRYTVEPQRERSSRRPYEGRSRTRPGSGDGSV